MLTRSKTEHKPGIDCNLDSLSQKCIFRRNTLAIGLKFAILHFNDGSSGILKILNCFGLSKQVTLVKGRKPDKS